MCLDASRRALQNAAPAASSPTHCSLGCCRSAARLLSAKKMSWELARFPHCRLEGGGGFWAHILQRHCREGCTCAPVHFPFPIAITSTSEPVASCWMLTELAWCFGWVCDRLRGMAWGKMGMGVGVLAIARPSNRTDIRTASWRAWLLGSKQDAKRARQRPACTCAGRTWWMLTTHKPQRCPATVPASWLPGPLDFRAPGGAGPAASGGVGRGEITSQKTPISSTQQLPNAPHRRDDAQGPNRPRALNQTSPLAAQPRSERRRAGPADLSLCLCLAVTSCPAIRRSLVVERCAIYTSPGSRRPRASEWPRLGIRAHPKVGSQYRGHPLADAPISATPRLPEIGLGGSALLSLALQPGGRATAMATGDSLQQGGGDGRWGFGAVGLMSIPQPVRSRDSVIPVKRAAASPRREAQPERFLAYTPSAQLA